MEVEKVSEADNKVILAALRDLTGRVTGLEAEIVALRAENKQLKQSIQQNTNMISTADLALIISLAGINNGCQPLTLDYLKVAEDSVDGIIIQYLARVALAKHINDGSEEYNAHSWGEDRLKYIEKKYTKYHDKIKNASAPEIVQMIKQLMNSAVVQKQEEHGQLTK